MRTGSASGRRSGGDGPPPLLHGHPQTHLTWHKIAPALAERLTVVATDGRGHGDSAKPEGGERLALLDNAPIATMYARTDKAFASRSFWCSS